MPKLRPAPNQPKEEIEQDETFYGSDKPKPLFESKDEEGDNLDQEQPSGEGDKGREEDPSLALKKQIEDLRRSEQLAREAAERANREREDAIRRANEREQEANSIRQEAVGSRMDAINAGIAAAQAEAEAAQRDIENAIALGDATAQAAAYRKLARAETHLSDLERGKAALTEEQERQKTEKPATKSFDQMTESEKVEATLAASNLPEIAKNWLRQHSDYMTDMRKNRKIASLHDDVVDEGHAPYSQGYFESLEVHLGLREKPKKQEKEDDDGSDDDGKGSFVSAPVSRGDPGGSKPTRPSQIRLTKAQAEAARLAGITEAEYAKQLLRLEEHKSNGMYRESR